MSVLASVDGIALARRQGRHVEDARATRRLHALRRLLSLRSLRTRLVLVVLAIDCVAALLTGTVIVLKARTATKLEIASSMQLAETLVADTIRLLKDTSAPVLLRSIDLHFQSVRHVRINVVDASGAPVGSALGPDSQAAQNALVAEAPGWFIGLVALPVETRDFPIVAHGTRIGSVTIRSEPSDEIGEAWHYAYALLVTALCLNLAVIAVLFVLFGRVLAPLSRLAQGLKTLEGNDYSVRLPEASLLELATITDLFNRAAEALAVAHNANRQLNRKLLTAQDDERRRTALELHDEAGPCLFALEANATSIAALSGKLPDGERIHGRAIDLVALVEKVQRINRGVLDRLRPMALGRIPLRECIIKLIVDFDIGGEGPAISPVIGDLEASYGFLIDLTVYRCVQEGLFNAIRHARATRLTLTLGQLGGAADARIRIEVRDDGIGFRDPIVLGSGLSGMRERVEALSGTFELASSGAGTRLRIVLPLDDGDHAMSDPPLFAIDQDRADVQRPRRR